MTAAIPLLTVAIEREDDIILARRRGREISRFLGFSSGDVTRITTALSEMARNAFEYGGGGRTVFAVETVPGKGQDLVIRIIDEGVGIENLGAVLSTDFKSKTGMGVGIRGCRALMDRFEISSTNGHGTTVMMAKAMPRGSPKMDRARAALLAEALAKATQDTPLGELQVQNQSLLNTLQELTEHQAEVERLGAVADEARRAADEARERAEEARRVAERSLVVRERFMALTTHELRTPLGAIVGYLELLEMVIPDATEKQKTYLERVHRATKHLLGITNDFLDMAQGDAGRLKVARHPGAARHVMSEAAALLAPQAAIRGVTVALAETTDHVMYMGDVARIRQILVNLIGNAVSFSPVGGHVSVIAEIVPRAPDGSALAADDGQWCVISVQDAGPGIPDDKILHVFEPFVQLSSDGQAARKGSGLGLTVSRQLASLMGGDLTAESTGSGAVFRLWLPVGAPPECRPAPGTSA